MFKNLFGVSIYKEVMSVLKKKIKEAQDLYDAEIEQLKESKWIQKNEILSEMSLKIDELNSNHDVLVHNAKIKHINSVLKKII